MFATWSPAPPVIPHAPAEPPGGDPAYAAIVEHPMAHGPDHLGLQHRALITSDIPMSTWAAQPVLGAHTDKANRGECAASAAIESRFTSVCAGPG